ncbi:hypothetical protein ANO11243_070400 [Dothideomycetidae sp. 11243]|nr:hypothetical protein ANO11243_070400 [fungal sp. No.11243]
MAAIVDHVAYNELPSLHEANISRQADFVDDLISGPLRDVFLKHDVHRKFSLFLQHRHHNVDAGCAIVKVDGTAHLMDEKDMNDIVSFGNKIIPATWMASSSGISPMEFAVVPEQ